MNIPFETSIIIISVIVYGVVFFIQKAQINKQNELFNKYEKIFNIINIDEIEKYIEVQKKSMLLSMNNREIELANNEKVIKEKIDTIQEILDSSKTNFEKGEEIAKNVKAILDKNSSFITEITDLNKSEFTELYAFISGAIKKDNPELFKKIEKEMFQIIEKYETKKGLAIDNLFPSRNTKNFS